MLLHHGCPYPFLLLFFFFFNIGVSVAVPAHTLCGVTTILFLWYIYYIHAIQEYCKTQLYSSVCVPVGLLGSDEEDLEFGVVVYLLLNLIHKQRGLDCSLNFVHSFVVVNPPVQYYLLQAHVRCMQFMNILSH